MGDGSINFSLEHQSLYLSLSYIQFARSFNSVLTGSLLDIHVGILWYYLPFANFNTLLGLLCIRAYSMSDLNIWSSFYVQFITLI